MYRIVYLIFWILFLEELIVEGKKNDKESDMVSVLKEKDFNIKRFKRVLGKMGEVFEYFFKWFFCYYVMKVKFEVKDFVRKIIFFKFIV